MPFIPDGGKKKRGFVPDDELAMAGDVSGAAVPDVATEKAPTFWESIFPRASKVNAVDTRRQLEGGIIDIASLPGRVLASLPALVPGGESFGKALSRTSGRDMAEEGGFNDSQSRVASKGFQLAGDIIRDPAIIPTLGAGVGASSAIKGGALLRTLGTGAAEGLASAGTHAVAADAAGERRSPGSLALEVASGPAFRGAGALVEGLGKGLSTVGREVSSGVDLGKGILSKKASAVPMVDKYGLEYTPAAVAGHSDIRNNLEMAIQGNAFLRDIPEEIKVRNVEATKNALLKERGAFQNAPIGFDEKDLDFSKGGAMLAQSVENAKEGVGRQFQAGERGTFQSISKFKIPEGENLFEPVEVKVGDVKLSGKSVNDAIRADAKSRLEEYKKINTPLDEQLYSVKQADPAYVLNRDERLLNSFGSKSERRQAVKRFFNLTDEEFKAMDDNFHVPGREGIDGIVQEKSGSGLGQLATEDRGLDVEKYVRDAFDHYYSGAFSRPKGMNSFKKQAKADLENEMGAIPQTEAEYNKSLGLSPEDVTGEIMKPGNVVQQDVQEFLISKGFNPKKGITRNESLSPSAIKYLDDLQRYIGGAETMGDLLNQRRNFAAQIKSKVWDTGKPFEDRDVVALNEMYGNLNKRIGETFEKLVPGEDGVTWRKMWDATREQYAQNHKILEDVDRGLGISNTAWGGPEKYFDRIKGLGTDKIIALKQSAKNNPDLAPVFANIQAGFFDSILKNSINKQTMQISPNRLASTWRGLDVGIKEAILGKESVNNISEIVDGVSKLKLTDADFYNTSGTERLRGMKDINIKKLIGSLLARGNIAEYYKTGNIAPAESVLSLISAAGKTVGAVGKTAQGIGKTIPYVGYGARNEDYKIQPNGLLNLNQR